ncbi:MAG: exosome complex protein Rrp42 [Candidatus Diapherotrites archaeon]
MTAIDILSELNSNKVVAELKAGKRLDGRKIDEYREIKIENGISENADGSARVKLGDTDVIFGVKMIVGEPYPDSPDKGSISVGVELLPLASPLFESGPPREAAIELSRVVDRGIRESKALDFKDLCLVEGEKVLVAFIDGYTINHAGNLFDACSIAAMSSILEARIPKIEDNKIVHGEYGNKLKVKRKPVLNTFAKIGSTIVADPSLAEEKAMDARFSVSVTEDDYMCAFQKGGSGSFTGAEISGMIETAFKNSKNIRKLFK